MKHRYDMWISVLAGVIFLALWEWLARAGVISALFFPPPSKILATLWQLTANGTLMQNLSATLVRLFYGILLGCVPGFLLGLVMGWSPRLRLILDPIVASLHPLPKIAMFPLIMIVFGIGESSKVVAIAIATFFPMLINSMAGVRQINPVYFEVTQNYGASWWKTFSRVIIPGSLPLVLTGMRLAINVGMLIGIAVELMSAQKGLGVLIWFAWQTFRIEQLYASLVVTAVLGVVVNFALQRLSAHLVPWYHTQQGSVV